MTTFLVERRARTAARAVASDGVDVRYVRSILVPADETAFHLFMAPSAAALIEVTRLASLRFTRIVEAIANDGQTEGPPP